MGDLHTMVRNPRLSDAGAAPASGAAVSSATTIGVRHCAPFSGSKTVRNPVRLACASRGLCKRAFVGAAGVGGRQGPRVLPGVDEQTARGCAETPARARTQPLQRQGPSRRNQNAEVCAEMGRGGAAGEAGWVPGAAGWRARVLCPGFDAEVPMVYGLISNTPGRRSGVGAGGGAADGGSVQRLSRTKWHWQATPTVLPA